MNTVSLLSLNWQAHSRMNRKPLILLLTIAVLGCSTAPRYGGKGAPKKSRKTSSKIKGHRRIQTGMSSYYAEDFHGKVTANGETYDMYGLTAAHKTLPLNTLVRVTNLDNKKSIILRINDRGPYAKGRILDCSYGAAVKLGFVGIGTAKVKIEIIEIGDDKYMKRKE